MTAVLQSSALGPSAVSRLPHCLVSQAAPGCRGLRLSSTHTAPIVVQSVGTSTNACRQRLRPPCSTATAAAIAADGWPVLALLCSCGALGQLMEQRTRIGRLLSAPMVAMAAALALAATGVIPIAACSIYDGVWAYMPLAATHYMLEHDITELFTSGGPVLLAFLIGAAGMLLGAAVAWHMLGSSMGPEGWKLAACLCASYVGGSINFAAVAGTVGLSSAAIPGAMVADNVAMAPLLAALMACPAPKQQPGKLEAAGSTPLTDGCRGGSDSADLAQRSHLTSETAAMALAAGAASVAIGRCIALRLQCGSLSLMFVSLVALVFSVLGAKLGPLLGFTSSPFAGSSELGTAWMMLYFAVIGASAGSLSSLTACGPLVGFIVIMCTVHWGVMLLSVRVLRLPVPATIIASNACVGGPATAAGMAVSRGWPRLAQPAMLCGSLGYALGTGAGLLVARVAAAGAL